MRRLLALILAMLMLALPVCGVAEGDFISEAVANGRRAESTVTFSVMETGEAQVDEIIGVLLEALAIKTYWQEGEVPQGGLVLHLNGTDVVSAELASKGDDRYIASDVLGGAVVICADEAEAVLQRLTDAMVAAELLDAATAASLRESFTASLEGAQNPSVDIDFEALVEGFNITGEEVEAWAEKAAARVEETDLSGLPEGCDEATAAYTVTVTADDIVKVYGKIFELLKGNAEYMKLLDSMLASAEDMSGAELIDQMFGELETTLPEMVKGDIVATQYLNANDETVAGVVTFVLEVNEGTPVDVQATYLRRTEEEATRHSVALTMKNDQDTQVNVTLTVAAQENGFDAQLLFTGTDDNGVALSAALTLMLTEQRTETERTLDVLGGLTYEDARGEGGSGQLTVHSESRKDGEDAEKTTVIALKYLDQEIFSVTTKTKTTDPVPSIATDEALRLAQLTDEEFQAWFDGLGTNLYGLLFRVIGALPASILMLLQ